MLKVSGSVFYGNKISAYGIEHGYVDYGTLAKAFDHVLANNALEWFDDWEPISGEEDDDIFQWYIVDERGAEILESCGESVWYSPSHELYLWGVTHLGTSWDYVLTNIKCNSEK